MTWGHYTKKPKEYQIKNRPQTSGSGFVIISSSSNLEPAGGHKFWLIQPVIPDVDKQ